MQPDLILTNANIYTMDPIVPRAGAIAIGAGRILAIGSVAKINALRRSDTIRHDLEGRTVLPGFIDAHLHFLGYGLSLREIDLNGATSLADAQQRIRRGADVPQAGHWITGRGWDQVEWPQSTFPTRRDLDLVTDQRPAFLRRKCGHAGWANGAALALAGISAQTPDPPGGEILRDPVSGEPTGILLERAMNLVSELIPEPSDDEALEALRMAQVAVHRLGITGVHNMEGAQALRAFQGLRLRGELNLRLLQQIPESELDAAIEIGLQTGFGDEWIRIGALKIFADGSLGARSALMVEPYEDEAENVGIAVSSAQHLHAQVEKAARAGLAVHIHAIGDLANRHVLDAVEATRRAGIGTHLRHRIEHAQLLHPDDVERFAQLKVIASMQPIHCTQDIVAADTNWGDRCRLAYAWSTLLSSGAALAFGSDAPVETPDVLHGLYAAVSRRRSDGYPGPEGWIGEECLSIEEALHAYTVGAAYASGEEAIKGSLAPGKLADLVILDRDIVDDKAEAIVKTNVVATMVGGEFVYGMG